MKTKIIDAIDTHLETYGDGDQDHVGITEKSLQITADELTQLMCNAAINQMWYFGGWPESFILLTNAQHAFLLNQGFTAEQIEKAIGNSDNLKEKP